MTEEHLTTLQPGTIIAGRYEVVKCLGAGSMGLVYACRHRELAGHLVAIKVLFPEVAQDKVAAARFRNEIFASYGVSHPHVVRAYEYIKDGDLVAYTMEHVGGGDLADKIGKHVFPIPEIVKLMSQMCSGVQAIHDAGIVHRDLKPENILLTKEGDVKIADFGIARTGEGPRLTEHGGVVGTIDYVSPEYMLNSHVDWRSDIYALGILSYEIITGQSPFQGDSVYATMTKRLKTDPVPPGTLREDCPPELDRIVLKAMARDPEERYQSAAQMYYALQAMAPEGAITSGTYMQISKNASSNYVGPTLEQIKEQESKEQTSASANAAGPRVIVTDDEDRVSVGSGRPGSPLAGRSAWGGGSRGTQVVHPKFDEPPPEQTIEDETIYQPMKMEQMLGRPRSGADEVEGAAPPTIVSLSAAGIDASRVRKLSQMVDSGRKSRWIDTVTFILAILLGIGVGVAIVKVLFPSLLESPRKVIQREL